MSDIDLIPIEFRLALGRQRELRLALAAVILAVAVSVSSGLAMGERSKAIDAERQRLARNHAVSEQQGNELTQLSGMRDKLLAQRDTLGQLRGGAAVTDLMLTIDRALPADDVWFVDWRFHRPGVDSDDDVNTNGYFVIVNGDADKTKVQTLMNINGQAVDHAALSLFVRRLFNQPEVQDVRVQQTTIRRYPTHHIVDFQLAVTLQTKAS